MPDIAGGSLLSVQVDGRDGEPALRLRRIGSFGAPVGEVRHVALEGTSITALRGALAYHEPSSQAAVLIATRSLAEEDAPYRLRLLRFVLEQQGGSWFIVPEGDPVELAEQDSAPGQVALMAGRDSDPAASHFVAVWSDKDEVEDGVQRLRARGVSGEGNAGTPAALIESGAGQPRLLPDTGFGVRAQKGAAGDGEDDLVVGVVEVDDDNPDLPVHNLQVVRADFESLALQDEASELIPLPSAWSRQYPDDARAVYNHDDERVMVLVSRELENGADETRELVAIAVNPRAGGDGESVAISDEPQVVYSGTELVGLGRPSLESRGDQGYAVAFPRLRNDVLAIALQAMDSTTGAPVGLSGTVHGTALDPEFPESYRGAQVPGQPVVTAMADGELMLAYTRLRVAPLIGLPGFESGFSELRPLVQPRVSLLSANNELADVTVLEDAPLEAFLPFDPRYPRASAATDGGDQARIPLSWVDGRDGMLGEDGAWLGLVGHVITGPLPFQGEPGEGLLMDLRVTPRDLPALKVDVVAARGTEGKEALVAASVRDNSDVIVGYRPVALGQALPLGDATILDQEPGDSLRAEERLVRVASTGAGEDRSDAVLLIRNDEVRVHLAGDPVGTLHTISADEALPRALAAVGVPGGGSIIAAWEDHRHGVEQSAIHANALALNGTPGRDLDQDLRIDEGGDNRRALAPAVTMLPGDDHIIVAWAEDTLENGEWQRRIMLARASDEGVDRRVTVASTPDGVEPSLASNPDSGLVAVTLAHPDGLEPAQVRLYSAQLRARTRLTALSDGRLAHGSGIVPMPGGGGFIGFWNERNIDDSREVPGRRVTR